MISTVAPIAVPQAAGIRTKLLARTDVLVLALILLVAGGIRVLGIRNGWLWMDELLSVNFAYNSLLDVIVTVLRFDVHAPLYYLQLSAWLTFGTDDTWIMLNSVAWSLAATSSVYWIGRRIDGARVGLTAAALFAVMPGAVLYGYEVRMYAVIMTAITWAWYFNHRLTSGNGGRPHLLGLVLSELAVIYSHAAGTVMLLGVVVYGAAALVSWRHWTQAGRWLLAQSIVGLMAIPVWVIGLARGARHTGVPDLDDVFGTLAFLIAGRHGLGAWAYVLVGGLSALLALGASCDRLVRALFGWAILLSVAGIALISVVLQPIWLERTVAFAIPLLCLAVALTLWRIPLRFHAGTRLWPTVVIAGLLLASGAASLSNIVGHRKGDGYRPLAEALRTQAAPGDIVYVETSDYAFWCLAWYFAGPDWGGPLSIHDTTPQWRRIYDRFGPEWTRRLGLYSARTELTVNGVRFVAGAVAEMPTDGKRPWRVSPGSEGPEILAFTGRLREGAPEFGQFILERDESPQEADRGDTPGS